MVDVPRAREKLKSTPVSYLGTAIVLLIVGASLWKCSSQDPPAGTAAPVAFTRDNQAADDGTSMPPAPSMPRQEGNFVAIILQAQQQSRSAENDMQRGGFKNIRDKALCALLPVLTVSNWIGTVKTVDSNSDGKGVLAIQLANNNTVTTNNNDFSDMSDNTLIEPGSKLFSIASALKPGDLVIFSGDFLPDNEGGPCIKEQSLTLRGKIDDPDFTFKFSRVSADLSAIDEPIMRAPNVASSEDSAPSHTTDMPQAQ